MEKLDTKHEITAIAALGKETRAIGKNNELLWKISGDLPRFKEITTGHPVIMGYATFQSMGEKLLPNRTNIILSHNKEIVIEGALVAHSKEEALEIAKKSDGSENIFVIGGGQIYALLLPDTDILDLTLVHDSVEGDTHFPEYSEFTDVISEEHHEEDGLKFTRAKLRRTK
ncbi:MAG: dihydrofolate reductase [Candidatus Pacebacteria bacterium]|nr:dihydrofolate reductase [Candidatus Paceibacterota bacterium]